MKLSKLLLILISVAVFSLIFPSNIEAKVVKPKTSSNAVSLTPSSPAPTLVPEPVDAYKLFWPIAPGKVMGDSMFNFKTLKEKVSEWFIFNSGRKAEYNVTLSEKRLVEAYYLYVAKKDYANAQKSIEAAKEKAQKASNLIKDTKDAVIVASSKSKFYSSIAKQKMLLTYVDTQVPNDQKSLIEDYASYLTSILPQLQ